MVTTRSKTTRTQLKDHATKGSASKAKTPKATALANTAKKRKSTDPGLVGDEPGASRSRTSTKKRPDGKTEAIIVHRAPVLTLWSACVTQFLYPELSWETCLSAGSAIAAICAVAKGRSIGTVPGKDKSKATKRNRKDDLEEIQVMQFHLRLRDGLVSSSDNNGKPSNEASLRRNFRTEEYEKAKGVFEEVLRTWERDEEELGKKAWGFYEQFRPSLQDASGGWGRKGELVLGQVREVVRREL
jgi:hypothetical protein